ncbi:MAG: response regulator [bacterium]|nr:response regulator [bacterium]
MNPKILVVDDSPVNREICRRSLANAFTIIEAESGEDCLQKVKEQKPNLILLDIMMGGIDGFTVLENLNSDPTTSGIPVLLLTAKGDIKDKQRGFELGAMDYITKPFDRLELLARVEARLRAKLEEERRVETAALEARSKAVSQLLITLSHYINNALAVLLGNIQIINPEDPEAVKRFLTQAKNQSERIRAVIAVLQDAAQKMNLRTMDDVGRKDFLFDIRDEMQKKLDDLQQVTDKSMSDWK